VGRKGSARLIYDFLVRKAAFRPRSNVRAAVLSLFKKQKQKRSERGFALK